jgi:hypothetical protein
MRRTFPSLLGSAPISTRVPSSATMAMPARPTGKRHGIAAQFPPHNINEKDPPAFFAKALCKGRGRIDPDPMMIGDRPAISYGVLRFTQDMKRSARPILPDSHQRITKEQ